MKAKETRNRLEIKIWMIRNRIKQKDVEKGARVTQSTVSKTLSGDINTRSVLRFLLDKGCPAEFLALPEDMREAV